jgi:ribose transport system substrate-binding protein
MRPWIKAIGLLTVLTLGVTGCSASTSNEGEDALEIGIVTFSATDLGTNQVVEGAKAAAAELGYSTTVVDANGSVEQANAAMQNLVSRDVDAIVVTIFPSSALGAGIAAAADAGIPVLSEGGGDADGVAFDLDLSLGAPIAERILADFPEGGNLLELTYRAGRPALLREQALDAELDARDDFDITKQEITVPGQVESARSGTQAWLSAGGATSGPAGIWTVGDETAIGAISALTEQGVSGVKVYTFNGGKEAIAAVQDGTLSAVVWIDSVSMGERLVEVAADIVDAGDSWTPKTEEAQYELVDADNVNEFLEAHPDAAP